MAFVSPGILDEDRVAFVMTGWDGREQDEFRRADAARMNAYALAAGPYLEAFGRLASAERRLPQAHAQIMALADRHLPETIDIPGGGHADVE